MPHVTKPVPTSSIYDYIHMDLGTDLLVMPRKRDLAELDQYPEIKLLTVPNPRFKLSLDAAYLKDAEDDSLLCLVDALKACYRAIYCQ